MEYDAIINLVNSVAFPILVSIALFWKMNKQDETHKKESEQMATAIENNTQAVLALRVMCQTILKKGESVNESQ